MSDYCGDCAYKVSESTGESACPFNALYWHFLMRHRDQLRGNQRLGMVYRNLERMPEEGEQFELAGLRISIKKMKGPKIVLAKVTLAA